MLWTKKRNVSIKNLAEPDHAFSVEEEKALIALCETTDNSITPPGGDSRKI